MFDTLGGDNQAGIAHFIIRLFLDHLSPFLQQAFDAFSLEATSRLLWLVRIFSNRTACSLVCSRCSLKPAASCSLLAAFTILGSLEPG
jgi:hypothetical protein